MASKVIFAVTLVLAVVAIQALPQGVSDLYQLQGIQDLRQLLFSDCPPENPFCPVWVPCNFTEVQGPTCGDCRTRIVCTPIGGLVQPCISPFRPHCVEGRCVREPTEACAPPTPPEPPTEGTSEPTEEITTEVPTTESPDTTEAQPGPQE